jgi:hypothetical protein
MVEFLKAHSEKRAARRRMESANEGGDGYFLRTSQAGPAAQPIALTCALIWASASVERGNRNDGHVPQEGQ